eukprot:COSAG04_NODE_6809_length_1251_cov_2.506076_1_plen_136_part_00
MLRSAVPNLHPKKRRGRKPRADPPSEVSAAVDGFLAGMLARKGYGEVPGGAAAYAAGCVRLPTCASHGLARHPARKDVFTQPECRCLQVSAAEVEATVAGSGMPEAWTQAMASRAEATAAAFTAKDGKKCAPHLK